MLKAMRKHAKYFYVLFFLIIATFIFWGVGSVDKSTGVPVATVGKERISAEEYWRAYDRTVGVMRDTYKEKFDAEMEKKLKLKERVLNQLIEERVLYQAAETAGIRVSDMELEDAITHEPAFQRDGAFQREIYIRTLELSRLTPQIYEADKRRELILEKMVRLITASVELSPSELKALSGEKRALKEIEKALLQAKQEMALASYIGGLKARANIKVNKELIAE